MPLTLGDFIATRRRELRLEQKDISRRLKSYGVDRATTTIAGWEQGGNVPPDLIPALAKALEMSPVKLYELAGFLAELPGSEIVKLLDGLPPEEIERVERMLRAYLEKP